MLLLPEAVFPDQGLLCPTSRCWRSTKDRLRRAATSARELPSSLTCTYASSSSAAAGNGGRVASSFFTTFWIFKELKTVMLLCLNVCRCILGDRRPQILLHQGEDESVLRRLSIYTGINNFFCLSFKVSIFFYSIYIYIRVYMYVYIYLCACLFLDYHYYLYIISKNLKLDSFI
ncbi:hypothetical protein M9H77_35826 [Catharanthus roseus]|uniref:Uncharacterized protein n=1 Tax=Catharanthus roseus TaxID=4058 RepID=A0ACB9ZQ40_CATRO|nr:hypothetical protein M9H77_35826 [Catharanthus roseus]